MMRLIDKTLFNYFPLRCCVYLAAHCKGIYKNDVMEKTSEDLTVVKAERSGLN